MISLILAAAISCGTERQDVKTLSDSVQLAKLPVSSSIESMISTKAPKWSNSGPRTTLEKKLVRIRGSITAFKVEDDNDIHVVLRNPAGETMVIEFPHPDCAGKGHVTEFAAVRRSLVKLPQKIPGPKVTKLEQPIPVEVIGVVFFDKVHGQLGVAPNGIELHPVFSITRK